MSVAMKPYDFSFEEDVYIANVNNWGRTKEAGDLDNHSLHDKGEERDDKGKLNYHLNPSR
jgi:hypothetical protein